MFWKKDKNKIEELQKIEDPISSIKYSCLKITFIDNIKINWKLIIPNESNKIVAPWLLFKKWFHSRKQSNYFTLKYNTGETTIIRSTIKYYEIFLKEENK